MGTQPYWFSFFVTPHLYSRKLDKLLNNYTFTPSDQLKAAVLYIVPKTGVWKITVTFSCNKNAEYMRQHLQDILLQTVLKYLNLLNFAPCS